MVCLGNICRSPMAQGILESKIAAQGLSIQVDSAATSAHHIGESPDLRASKKTKEYNIDISNQRGRQFVKEDFDSFDRIFAMDTSNLSNILALAETEKDTSKVELILNLNFPNENRSVPDPYFGGEEGFENVYRLLDNACDILLNRITNG